MAQYKYSQNLTQSTSVAFDTRYAPGAKAENPGIYLCPACGDEICVAKGRLLPSQNNHPHTAEAKAEWQLLVLAQQR
jgi:hypothetical protein